MRDPLPPTNRVVATAAAKKPLLGFGVVGWIALPILLALIGVVVTGYDLRYQIQRLIADAFGIRVLFDFTIYVIIGTGMGAGTWPPVGRFGPVAMSIVLVALWIHPRRVGVIRTGLIWALGLVGPALAYRLATDRAVRRLADDTATWELVGIVWLALAATLIWLATRSWRVGALAALCLALPLAGDLTSFLAMTDDIPRVLGQVVQYQAHLALAMHAGLALVLIPWSVHARRHVVPDFCCPRCGYDIRGLPPPCPECGSSPSGSGDRAVDLPRGRADVEAGSPVVPSGAQRDQEHDRIR